MKIALRQEEYGFLVDMLRFVDGRSYDPIYKNIAERIEKTVTSQGVDKIVALEESEIFNTLDALNEYLEEAEAGNYEDDARKDRISQGKEMRSLIEDETGISI